MLNKIYPEKEVREKRMLEINDLIDSHQYTIDVIALKIERLNREISVLNKLSLIDYDWESIRLNKKKP